MIPNSAYDYSKIMLINGINNMRSPIVLVPACINQIGAHANHTAQLKYVAAVTVGAHCTPLIVPALGDATDFDAVLDIADGIMLTGSPSNVHASLYGQDVLDPALPQDPARDATTLPLIRKAIERGVPLLAICRGIQELNVALGGTLGTEIQEREGSLDHRAPVSDKQDERFAIHQTISIKPGSCLAGVFGAGDIKVNSLHRQAIDRLGSKLEIEAVATDGTVEAVSVKGARAFAVGVQWHPEYWVKSDSNSVKIFRAFGDAVRLHAAAKAGARAAAE